MIYHLVRRLAETSFCSMPPAGAVRPSVRQPSCGAGRLFFCSAVVRWVAASCKATLTQPRYRSGGPMMPTTNGRGNGIFTCRCDKKSRDGKVRRAHVNGAPHAPCTGLLEAVLATVCLAGRSTHKACFLNPECAPAAIFKLLQSTHQISET